MSVGIRVAAGGRSESVRPAEPRANLKTATATGASQVGFRFLLGAGIDIAEHSVHANVAQKIWRNPVICHEDSLITTGRRGKQAVA